MSAEFCSAPGSPCDQAQFKSPKAKGLSEALLHERIAYSTLVEHRSTSASEVVVLDVEVELGQKRVHDIRPVERIAIEFELTDEHMPRVLALRADFPLVPHLNISYEEFPRELCLYDEAYHELKRRWTATRIVERVRTWLALTAKGKLHQDDQPLEPLLWGHKGRVFLPSDVMVRKTEDMLVVHKVPKKNGGTFLRAEFTSDSDWDFESDYFLLLKAVCPARTHGTIRYRPSNLKQLAEFCDLDGFSLLAQLRSALSSQEQTFDDWLSKQPKRMHEPFKELFLRRPVMILIWLPKKRDDDLQPEAKDLWAFCSDKPVREVGIEIGLWHKSGGDIGTPLEPDLEKTGEDINVELYSPTLDITRELSGIYNGLPLKSLNKKLVAVGAGALGSNVICGLAKQGFGDWTILDHDVLMPHNVARHILNRRLVGFDKAPCVAYLANQFCEDANVSEGLNVNVLKPGQDAETIAEKYNGADAIVDLSASVAVERHLAVDVESSARRISVYLNPSGTDLVVLAEDAERSQRLDHLEMTFYQAISQMPDLASHFSPAGKKIRYGQSCRDISFRISNELVSLHSAIACRAIRNALDCEEAAISVWRSNDQLEVNRFRIEPDQFYESQFGEWKLFVGRRLIELLQENRQSKLPNETGGVLLGSTDFDRKTIYVVDSIGSPPDSQEWPTVYVRGKHGLKPKLDAIMNATDGAFHYLGEWHSHPNGCSTAPSDDDVKVFHWLNEILRRDGYPGLMMIVGQSGISCFVDSIEREENLISIGELAR